MRLIFTESKISLRIAQSKKEKKRKEAELKNVIYEILSVMLICCLLVFSGSHNNVPH